MISESCFEHTVGKMPELCLAKKKKRANVARDSRTLFFFLTTHETGTNSPTHKAEASTEDLHRPCRTGRMESAKTVNYVDE